jgi:flagellar biosynthesis protein FlhG
MFAASRQRFVPLVHNPHVAFGGIAMERLCATFADRQLRTLVVDAADTASTPHEVASVDLSACIEPLSASVSFLAARGLPMRWLNSRGNTSGFLNALAESAPRNDVVLVHAGATDLVRLFGGRAPRPVLLASDEPDSLTHAYASMKLLSQRLGVMAFDLLLAAPGSPQRMARIADRLAGCADRFLGATLGAWAVADPTGDDTAPPDAALRRLAAAQLSGGDEDPTARQPGAVPAFGARTVYAN